MSCPDQNLCREIIPHLAPIQMGEVDPKDFPIATREEMDQLWAAEEEAVMQAEFRMLEMVELPNIWSNLLVKNFSQEYN